MWELTDPSRVLLAGLTGGIASGKSTAAGMFRTLGLAVIDADAIVHELLADGGAAVDPVLEAFGESFRDRASGGVDRASLGACVFADHRARGRLEQIVHPLVAQRSRRQIRELADRGAHRVVLYDAALLVETGRYQQMHRLIVVFSRPEQQRARLAARDGLSQRQIVDRIGAQAPLADKVALADYVIDNSGRREQTRLQVLDVAWQLREDARRLRAGEVLPMRRGRAARAWAAGGGDNAPDEADSDA
ncbi:MAG: dephospho-CoA kinase [Acidobacteriota bacterium]|nr:MAG: dephospho-CoA kinase [Acidobacteriota bacterium]